MNWVLVSEEKLSSEDEQIYKELSWPQLQREKTLASRYDAQHKCHLFTFKTDSPAESITVRALIHSYGQLSEEESEYFVMRVRYILMQKSLERHWQEHDTWIKGLNSLTSMLDLNELLHNIIQNALIAIPTVDRGFFALYDSESQKLIPKAAVGMEKSIYNFKTDIGEGIAGKVFQDETGCIYSPEQSIEAINNLNEDNLKSLMKATGDSIAKSPVTMAVLVKMNKDKFGVMVVHQMKKHTRKLTNKDLRWLQGFADQAAIAISNAKLFSELRETNEYLIRRDQIHDAFTSLSLQIAELDKIVKIVERLIGLPVFLFDLTQNKWHPYAETSFNLEESIFSKDWINGVEPLTVTVNKSSFYLYPIVNEGLPIGYFTVELSRPLQPLDTVVLEQGSALVALKMVNTYSMTDMYYKKVYEFFNKLLQYREPSLLEKKSKEYGLSSEKPLFVAILQVREKNENIKKRETYMRQLIASLHKEFKSSNYLLFGFQDKITLVIHAENDDNRDKMIRKIKAAGKRWESDRSITLLGGIGQLYTGLELVAKSSEEANKSLEYLLNRDVSEILQYEKVGINRLFLNQDPKDIEQFIREVLSSLQSPKAKSSDLELTLNIYIETNRSISVTAEHLHIHPNTLYHRLRKIEDILKVDLEDPDDWLTLQLACHLSKTY